jgi:hypothetical protein
MQRAQLDARDRAAAGADLLDIDHWNLHRQPGGIATDQRAAGHQHRAVVDHASFCGGAAHVEGDGVPEPNAVAQRLGADDTGGRPRLQHPDAGALRFLDPEQPAGRLHDQKVASEARIREVLAHLAEIAPSARCLARPCARGLRSAGRARSTVRAGGRTDCRIPAG